MLYMADWIVSLPILAGLGEYFGTLSCDWSGGVYRAVD